MPALDAAPVPEEPRDATIERHNARLGLWLFAVYLIGYAAFVLVSAFSPQSLDAVPAGMALIVGAMILSLVYAWFCRNPKGAA